MFNNNIRVESVPKRVFEFCRIAAQNPIQVKELQEKIFPSKLNSGTSNYFTYVREAALELDLVMIDENDVVSFIGNKDVVKNLDEFRRYCNSVVWKDHTVYFYKIAVAFLESNLEWLKYKSFTSSTEVQSEVRNFVGNDNDLPRHLLGERFWMSFLGFGQIQEMGNNSIWFLPNMYEALKDFIVLSNVPVGKEMTVGEFVEHIRDYASVALTATESTHKFNYAMSSALRALHDNKEIMLKRNSDSEEIWSLYTLQSHEFTSEITHVVVKGVK